MTNLISLGIEFPGAEDCGDPLVNLELHQVRLFFYVILIQLIGRSIFGHHANFLFY